VENTERTFIGLPKETSHQERRCLHPMLSTLDLSWSPRNDRIQVGERSYSDKEYSDAGAEVTQGKSFWCPMILKVEPPTLEEIEMMNNQSILISAIQ
jgi:alanine dehydrogenase